MSGELAEGDSHLRMSDRDRGQVVARLYEAVGEGRITMGEFEPVSSSNIDAYRYDENSKTLWIKFHGGRVYRYEAVSQDVADGIGTAGSPGGYFHANIKGAYRYTRE